MSTLRLERRHVYAGPRAPEPLTIDLEPGYSGIDLSTVSAAVIENTGTNATWACVLSGASATALTLTHVWQAGDADTAGEVITCKPKLTTPGGTVRTAPFEIEVLPY